MNREELQEHVEQLAGCELCHQFIKDRENNPAFVATIAFSAVTFGMKPVAIIFNVLSMHHELDHPDDMEASELFAQWDKETNAKEAAQWN